MPLHHPNAMTALLGLVLVNLVVTAPAVAPATVVTASHSHPKDALDRGQAKTSRSYVRPRPQLAPVLVLVAKPKPKPKPRIHAPVPRRTTAVNWDAIAKCESGGHWNHHSATAGLYWGGLQMDMTFWRHNGGLAYAARPDLATKAQQIAVAERAYRSRGLSPWPTCGAFG